MDADRPGRVIVGIDHSLSGLHALRTAVNEARVRGVALHAVRCWQPSPSGPGSTGGVGTGLDAGGTDAGAAAAAAVIARAFAETMGGQPTDLEVRSVAVPDSAGPVLVEYACRDQDVLVLGAGRRSRLRRWRGPVVRHCVTRARCPVLVVPPPPLIRGESPRAMLRQLRRDLDQLAKSERTPPD